MIQWKKKSQPGGPHKMVVPSTCMLNRFHSRRGHQRIWGAMWCTCVTHVRDRGHRRRLIGELDRAS